MAHRGRALALVLVTVPLAVACVSVAPEPRVTEAPPPVVPAPGVPAPIAGHPPVSVTGVVGNFDQATEILTFDDGRMVKLTGRSNVVKPDASAVRAGDVVTLEDVLPVGVHSGAKTLAVGKPQRMATIAAVDEPAGVIRLTDGTIVRVTGSTSLHLRAAGSSVALSDLNPGDELLIVLSETSPAPADGSDAVSALPRQDARPRAPEAAELMVFKVPRK